MCKRRSIATRSIVDSHEPTEQATESIPGSGVSRIPNLNYENGICSLCSMPFWMHDSGEFSGASP